MPNLAQHRVSLKGAYIAAETLSWFSKGPLCDGKGEMEGRWWDRRRVECSDLVAGSPVTPHPNSLHSRVIL